MPDILVWGLAVSGILVTLCLCALIVAAVVAMIRGL